MNNATQNRYVIHAFHNASGMDNRKMTVLSLRRRPMLTTTRGSSLGLIKLLRLACCHNHKVVSWIKATSRAKHVIARKAVGYRPSNAALAGNKPTKSRQKRLNQT